MQATIGDTTLKKKRVKLASQEMNKLRNPVEVIMGHNKRFAKKFGQTQSKQCAEPRYQQASEYKPL